MRLFRRPQAAPQAAVSQASDDSSFPSLESELLQKTRPQEVYARILAEAAALVQPVEVAVALLLLKDEAIQPLKPSAEQISTSGGWIVVTHTIGDYHTVEKEWPLTDNSITRRALTTKSTQRIDDMGSLKEGEYKSGGTDFFSEMNVPLIHDNVLWGTIDLLSIQKAAFTPEHVMQIEKLAQIAVRAIIRVAAMEQDLNTIDELRIAQQIQAALTPLAHTDISIDEVEVTCRRVMDTILTLACNRTESVLGQVNIAVLTPGKLEPDLVVYAVKGVSNPHAPRRWPASFGNTGQAFMSHKPVLLADTDPHDEETDGTGQGGTFLRFFSGHVSSELAVPMLIESGEDGTDESALSSPIGVVNVESELPHHYTRTHQHVLTFLARQAAFAYMFITLAAKQARERRLTVLDQLVRGGIDNFRSFNTIDAIDHGRNSLRQTILNGTIDLLGLRKATIFIASGVYSHEETTGDRTLPNTITGRMVEVTTAPIPLVPDGDRETLSFERSMSGQVFITKQPWIFNMLAERPAIFHTMRDQQYDEVRSGGVFPIFEGARTIGTLVLDADHEGQFFPENIAVATEIAEMISEVVVAARLRIEEIQSQRLRAFERKILETRVSDKGVFFKQILEYAAQLSDSNATWGQYAEIRRYPNGDGTFSPRISATYSAILAAKIGEIADWQPHDYQLKPLSISAQSNFLFAEVISSKQGRLLVDVQSDPFPSVLRAEARSLICVPLIRSSTQNPYVSEVVGILSVASDRPARLNDSDLKALTLFAQTMTLGLLNQDQLDLLQDFTQQIMHDLLKVTTPLLASAKETEMQVNRLTGAVAADVTTAITLHLQDISNLGYLLQDLLFASQDATDNHMPFDASNRQTFAIGDVFEKMRTSAETLAKISSRHLVWVPAVPPPYTLTGGELVGNLVQAALFQYLVNALKYGNEESEIQIVVDLHPPDAPHTPQWIVIEVRSHGKLIADDERPFLFDRGFRGTNLSSNEKGRGIGLFLAAQIAKKLQGDVAYRAEYPDNNIFLLRLPRALNPTRLRGV